jgi:nucleotidyltransferase-like protein
MNRPGDAETLVAARSALLDALAALADQREALVLIGAQAIYLHTGAALVALGEATKDTDLAVDPRALNDDPLLDEAMERAGFHRNLTDPQPGSWLSPRGIPVDLMVPAALAGEGGRRGGRIPPHSRHATRRTPGLEAAVVDHAPMTITALDPNDTRSAEMEVAGPAALLIAKLHKLGERRDTPGRLLDKDAHDIYRLLVATETATLAVAFARLQGDQLAGSVTDEAIVYLQQLFASGPDALGSEMAGRAEELFGNAEVVSAAVATLAADLLGALPGR